MYITNQVLPTTALSLLDMKKHSNMHKVDRPEQANAIALCQRSTDDINVVHELESGQQPACTKISYCQHPK